MDGVEGVVEVCHGVCFGEGEGAGVAFEGGEVGLWEEDECGDGV